MVFIWGVREVSLLVLLQNGLRRNRVVTSNSGKRMQLPSNPSCCLLSKIYTPRHPREVSQLKSWLSGYEKWILLVIENMRPNKCKEYVTTYQRAAAPLPQWRLLPNSDFLLKNVNRLLSVSEEMLLRHLRTTHTCQKVHSQVHSCLAFMLAKTMCSLCRHVRLNKYQHMYTEGLTIAALAISTGN